MSKITKIFLTPILLIAFFTLGINVNADYAGEYNISSSEGEYILTQKEKGEIFRSSELENVINYDGISAGSFLTFSSVSSNKDVSVKNSGLVLSGILNFENCDFSIESDTVFNMLSLQFTGNGGVRIKEGELSVRESTIASNTQSAVRIDYSSGGILSLESGKLLSASASGTVYARLGTVYISGGEVSNTVAAAVNSKTGIYLYGSPKLEGADFDIYTEEPITLSRGGEAFKSQISVFFNSEFENGSASIVFYKCSEESISGISLYDSNFIKQNVSFFSSSPYFNEKSFAAVYLPHAVRYYDGALLLHEEFLLSGEPVSDYLPPEKKGYSFKAWYTSPAFNGNASVPVYCSEDLNLYAEYTLQAPEFSISSLSFTYDGAPHFLSMEKLSHPLLAEADVGYSWYRGGELISTAEKLQILNVSDAGEYICKLLFTHNGNSTEISTPPVKVEIKKFTVELPTVFDKEYNGEYQSADISSGLYYTVSKNGGVDVGEYPVTITLRDPLNYTFELSDLASITLPFNVKKASNKWSVYPEISSIYQGQAISPFAISLFGEVGFLYSESKNGSYSATRPSSVGTYYMKAYVDGNDNYTSLISEPLAFSVLEELPVGAALQSSAHKTQYRAFEHFVKDGATLLITYNSGRIEVIPSDKLSVEYQKSNCLLYGDGQVLLSYGGVSAVQEVNVSRADYDMSGVIFRDAVFVYDGSFKIPKYDGALPVGVDGIGLCADVYGVGRDAGEYEIRLEFKTESLNYNTPPPISARLIVLPKSVNVIWENTEFIYNGKAQVPTAYFTDVNGKRININVDGARVFAGAYTAEADNQVKNYSLLNSECDFIVKKADYDMSGVFWSADKFVYDGSLKSVVLNGLPSGVSVVGYADNSAKEAGSYIAKLTLSYDSVNYNPPKLDPFKWEIQKAEYSSDGFSFSSAEYIYDGETHYPVFSGEMPIGADGIALSYKFDRGALHVSDGTVLVTVSFESESRNYITPPSLSVYVKILPRGINVLWDKLSFVYSGEIQTPTAYSDKTEIKVVGGERDAGFYEAQAICVNSDYYVLNANKSYEIKKTENLWTETIFAEDIYEDGEVSVSASAISGEISYRYFSDSELVNEIEKPTGHGVYYVVAYTDGGKNYSPLISAPASFEIRKLEAVEIYASLIKDKLYAFERLTPEDFVLYAIYNSGAHRAIDTASVEIKYENGDTLRRKDKKIEFSYLGLSYTMPINVALADYDMSSAVWSSGDFVYNGEEQSITLSSLPQGVYVKEYIGNGAKVSGVYYVKPVFIYDTENYNEPKLEDGIMEIKKCPLPTPVINSAIFSGESLPPFVENAELYNISKNLYRDASLYSVSFEIKDKENYYFAENGGSVIFSEYRILPREVEIIISPLTLYFLEDWREPEYTLVGDVALAEDLELEFKIENGKVLCSAGNKNYTVKYAPADVIYLREFSPRDSRIILIFSFVLVLILFIIAMYCKNRERFRRRAALAATEARLREYRTRNAPPVAEAPLIIQEQEATESYEEDEDKEESVIESVVATHFSTEISPERADSLISDNIAKTLVREKESIEVVGTKRGIINIDTLSSAFNAGERVDINIMKSKKLIPYDTAYIKVLARGILDKPLSVYANDFSLSAVKMIALMGGEAIKIKSVKVKFPKNLGE